PRDGRFLEKLGTYNPLLPKDSEERIKMDLERVQYWLGQGAQPTDRVARFLEAAGVKDKTERANLKKGEPGKAAKERAQKRLDREEAARAAAEEAKNAPVVEDTAAEDTAAEAGATDETALDASEATSGTESP
ncbi:30S ribosomal protein S16, partial [Paracoccus sphaerophysae]|uniref:30S ribosomal protein S16 n=1 Tax=Paracoccus sphaerophysae TaxID=690417 RepID=UPI00235306FC